MNELIDVIVRDLHGKGQVRLYLQPALATALGIRLGIADAKEGKAPFFFRLFRGTQHPWRLLKQSLSDAIVPLSIAIVIDSVLQHLTIGTVRPLAAVIVAALLVWLPFSVARGLANRAWRGPRLRSARARR